MRWQDGGGHTFRTRPTPSTVGRGGSYEIRSAAAGIGVRGEFTALKPPTSIRMTWIWLDEDRPSDSEDVAVDFEPVAGGTLVRVTHDCAANGDDLRQGWVDVLARLAGTS
jgi:uncharacterized protein YndB with AHSA1/START domain